LSSDGVAAVTSSELRRPVVGRRSVRSAGGVDFSLAVYGRIGDGREDYGCIGSRDEHVPKNLKLVCRIFGVDLGGHNKNRHLVIDGPSITLSRD
jgi:hypothetical protein